MAGQMSGAWDTAKAIGGTLSEYADRKSGGDKLSQMYHKGVTWGDAMTYHTIETHGSVMKEIHDIGDAHSQLGNMVSKGLVNPN